MAMDLVHSSKGLHSNSHAFIRRLAQNVCLGVCQMCLVNSGCTVVLAKLNLDFCFVTCTNCLGFGSPKRNLEPST